MKKYLFIAISFYPNVFLLQYCVWKCLVCNVPNCSISRTLELLFSHFAECLFFSKLIFLKVLFLFCFTNYSIVLQRWLISWWSMFWSKNQTVFSISSLLTFSIFLSEETKRGEKNQRISKKISFNHTYSSNSVLVDIILKK